MLIKAPIYRHFSDIYFTGGGYWCSEGVAAAVNNDVDESESRVHVVARILRFVRNLRQQADT